MLCYRDRTFCASDCTNENCSRFVSQAVEADAARLDLPLALSDFSPLCPDYVRPRAAERMMRSIAQARQMVP